MTPMDYRKLEIYNQEVNRWSVDLQDSIQRSFPWDVRNPSHTEFPWNMMSRDKRHINDQNRRHRHKRFMPFPVVPYFC
ncbi:unnamed protein product [Brugia timori]|nr:unnamed protein product [Brugia timori]